jgi:hypothetical protein
MNRLIILILFSLQVYTLSANQPYENIEVLQSKSIHNSSLIFLGEIIGSNSSADTIYYRIFEKFKGSYNLDSICVIGSFDENINFQAYDGLWIVYLEKLSDSSYHFCRGGLSRSLKHPEWVFVMTYIESFVKSGYDTTKLRIDATSDWFLELEKLRMFQKSKNVDNSTGTSRFIIVTFIISLVNLLILIYFIINKIARR